MKYITDREKCRRKLTVIYLINSGQLGLEEESRRLLVLFFLTQLYTFLSKEQMSLLKLRSQQYIKKVEITIICAQNIIEAQKIATNLGSMTIEGFLKETRV